MMERGRKEEVRVSARTTASDDTGSEVKEDGKAEGAPGGGGGTRPLEGRAGSTAHAGTHLAEEEADLAAAGIASE